MKPFGDLEAWLLTGTQDLYGDAVLATVDEHGRRLAAALDAAPGIPVHIRHYGYIRTAEAARNACLEANAADRCIGVIVWAHTFCPQPRCWGRTCWRCVPRSRRIGRRARSTRSPSVAGATQCG